MALRQALRAARRPLWASEVTRVRNADAALPEAVGEVAPMDLGFGKGAGDSEDHSLAVVAAHADGDEGGTIPDHTVDTDFVVGGVEGEVEDLGEDSSTPFCELGIELFGEDGDLA